MRTGVAAPGMGVPGDVEEVGAVELGDLGVVDRCNVWNWICAATDDQVGFGRVVRRPLVAGASAQSA